jgi:hypothetical protein
MSAELIVAGIAATLQAVQTWYQARDSHRASTQMEKRVEKTTNPDVSKAAAELATIVPQPVLDTIQKRLDKCWTQYQSVLERPREYTPAEIDDATAAVVKCVCREVMRVHDLNGGHIPEGPMKEFFKRHNCVSG